MAEQQTTKIRVVESDRVLSDAQQILRAPADSKWYIAMQMGIIETPLGYIVVDEEGGHHKVPFLSSNRVTLLVWDKATGKPCAEAPVTVKELLRYTNRTMPVADFVSNRDGMEERWEQLLITLMSAGIIDVEADRARRAENNRSKITGGAVPFDLQKNRPDDSTG